MVEIESCFLQLSISTVYYYHISALDLNPRDENMPKTSSFSLNLVCICCPTENILFNAVGDKCKIYHQKQLSISTVHCYRISALDLNPRDKNMPKASSFSLNLVCICCPTKDILFNAVGDKCRIYHLKLKSIVQRQHSLPAFIDE